MLVAGACDPPTEAPAPLLTTTANTATPSADAAAGPPPAVGASTSTAAPSARVEPQLRFERDGRMVVTLRRGEMTSAIASVTFRAFDPYYQRVKGYRALPCKALLEHAFAAEKLKIAAEHFVLVASDGYTVPIDGKRLLDAGCHVAIEDLDAPDWQPIGSRGANPGPFYLVWSGKNQADLEQYPRPWQLAEVRIARFDDSFPHVVPKGVAKSDPATRGFELFREQCIRCHSINREGGKVGPDLNVPQSIVEYRPEAQIRRYIKNPRAFRYGNMPENPHLTPSDLDGLIAYFRIMSGQKHDAAAVKAKP